MAEKKKKRDRISPKKVAELWPKIRRDYLSGSKPLQLSKKYGIKIDTIKKRVCEEKLYHKRKEILAAKQQEIEAATKAVNEELAEGIKDEIIQVNKESIRKHHKWREGQLEKMKERLESDAKSVDDLGVHASNVEKIDNLARKTYQLDKDDEVSNEQRWIGFLVNFKPEDLKPKEKVIEATVVD